MGAHRRAAFALAGLICGGCGGSANVNADAAAADAGRGESIGDVNASPFIVRSVSASHRDGDAPWIGVGLTTQSGTECGPVHEGGSAIELYAYSQVAPFVPGTYPIVADAMGKPFGDADLHTFGAACTELGVGASTDASMDASMEKSGTITITTIEPRVTGSFDVVTRGVHFAGTFDAMLCDDDGGPMSVGLLDVCR